MRVLKVRRKKVNVEGACFSPDGTQLIVCAENVEVGPWDIQTGLPTSSDVRLALRPGMRVAFHPSGRWLFGTGNNYGLVAFDLVERVSHRWPGEPEERAGCARFTPDGTILLHTLYHPGRYRAWERRLICRPWNASAPAAPIWAAHPYPDHPDRESFVTGMALLDGERLVTADYAFGH